MLIVRGSIAAYGMSFAAVAVAVGVRLLLDPFLGDRLPFVTLFAAIVFMAWQGGRGPALLTLGVGLGAATFFLLAPRYSFAIDEFAYQVGLVFYAVVGFGTIAMFDASERTKRRLEEEVAARRAAEQVVAEREEFLRVTLASIGDAVITTDPNGTVISLNGVAQELTGWTQEEACGHPLTAVFTIITEESRQPVENPVEKALREGRVVGLANHSLLISKDGTERPIDDSAAPIRDDQGRIVGVVLIFRDISERRETERQLSHSERELADFFENATVSLHWVGPDGTILRANQAELDLLGYTRDEYVGRPITDFHADEDVICDILKRLRAGEKLAEYPARLRCKDGSIKDVLIDSGVLFREGGFVHTRCFTRDVTERKQAEEELRQRMEELQTLMDTVPVGVFVAHDPECRLITGNAAAHTLLQTPNTNLSKTAPAGAAPTQFRVCRNGVEIPPDQLPIQRAAKGEFVQYEEVDDVFEDGAVLHTLVSAAPLYDGQGQVRGAVATILDVTGQKRVIEALRLSEEGFRSLAEGMPHCVWVCDGRGMNEYQNRQWHEYTGTPPGTCRGTDWLDYYHPDDRPHLLEEWNLALRSGGSHAYDIEVRIRRHDAAYRWFRIVGSPITDADGGVVRWAGTCTDIHEQRTLLQALRDADRRKDEFLATLAHELRNPLAPVRNAVQVLHMKGGAIPELQWSSDVIDRQVQAMTRLIDDLMDVSRINLGKIELKREHVELANVVQGAVETSRPLIEELGHALTVTLPPQPVIVDADLTRLAQVFLNLLNNAAKYTDRGGRIDLRAELQGSDVVVSVTDTGIGIPADKLPTLFEMFSQVDEALSRSQGGLGIGLCLVKQLVEMHAGSVEANSGGPGQGSEFVVRLPIVVERTFPRRASNDGDKARSTSDLRILVVDDNRDAAESLAMLLKMMGNHVHTAHDGEEAVAAAGEYRPHVVLCDIGLPKLNGYEACRQMKEQAWDDTMVLIALTGWGQDDDRRQSEEAGFDYHMVKPVDPQSLMKLLAGLDTLKV